jgi:hypothetical protein
MAKTCDDYMMEQEIFMHFITTSIYLTFDTLIFVQNIEELYSSLQHTMGVFSSRMNRNSAANLEEIKSK